ncbi:MAG: PilZ domain-containing protein [Sedimentisphaerales bacterium]|nr:PilZ domain-containing protein [Sedimentisphaerales bacterium]
MDKKERKHLSPELSERRGYRRLAIHLPLEFQRAGSLRSNYPATVTSNVSTGGVCFETSADDLQPGDELQVHLGVPPGDERFPQHGKITALAEILRCRPVESQSRPGGVFLPRYTVAARFRQSLKLIF